MDKVKNIQNLMCCGNCDNSRINGEDHPVCRITESEILSAWYCSQWEFDNIANESRDMTTNYSREV